ncbi:MAG: LPXTG cell wall anchor domain-containing protein [Actinokineospora sp.]
MAVTASPAMAQEQPTTPVVEEPTEVERPSVLLLAVASCADGVGAVDVRVRDDRDKPYSIALTHADGAPFGKAKDTELTKHDDHLTTFLNVPPGQYTVRPSEGTQPSESVDVVVKPCGEVEPGGENLAVEVECKAGWGIVTFTVTNPTSGEAKSYFLKTGDLSTQFLIELGEGQFLRIAENGYEDGKFSVTLTGDSIKPITKDFTVACAAENAPKLDVSANCDSRGKEDVTAPAPLYVDLTNPNRAPVEYKIKAGGDERVVTLAGGESAFLEFEPLTPGLHTVTVTGSDGTVTEAKVAVDDCTGVDIDEDGLQVEVRCAGTKSVVTFRFFDIGGEYPLSRDFSVDGEDRYSEKVVFADEGSYQWTKHTGTFADGEYTARLVGAGLNTVEKFTVKCADQPGATTEPTTTGPAPSTTPAPQAGTAPAVDDTLPVTGAAVGTMVALGLAALGLGGFLVITARRKRSAK